MLRAATGVAGALQGTGNAPYCSSAKRLAMGKTVQSIYTTTLRPHLTCTIRYGIPPLYLDSRRGVMQEAAYS